MAEELLAELEIAQKRILQRITGLELVLGLPLHPHHHHQGIGGDTESRLSILLREGGVRDFSFRRVPLDYYERSIHARREILGAPTIHHLCKSIVMVCIIYYMLPSSLPTLPDSHTTTPYLCLLLLLFSPPFSMHFCRIGYVQRKKVDR